MSTKNKLYVLKEVTSLKSTNFYVYNQHILTSNINEAKRFTGQEISDLSVIFRNPFYTAVEVDN